MVKSEITLRAECAAAKMMTALGGALPIFITHAGRAPDPVAVARGLPQGAVVIVRDYDHADRPGLARTLRNATKARGQLLLVAGDAALARAVGADGVHLPEHQLVRPPVLNGFSLVTAACHSRAAMTRAVAIGVDIVLVSPVFETQSHVGVPALGLHRFARLIAGVPLPVAALGGVNSETAKKLRPLGIAAFAAIDGFIG
ncbi:MULTISPECIES: thiamine phosphate synthase [Kordiimonas]|jgi:thiamine monophosphate synthase|uniref:thiamine phosphate synthase n=1 Tax=Kordiimonas TaxID=288021 RepID=UPI00257EFC7E|nr:thiamine phosphate synthase [Kordiimonas sp. UBA4487]